MNARVRTLVHASGNDERCTPGWLFRRLNREFGFDLDAAATRENALCPLYYTVRDNALRKRWDVCRHAVVFLNPPYSQTGAFVKRAYDQMVNYGVTTVLLLASRTDTKYFHAYIWDEKRHEPHPWAQVRFWKGRLHFDREKNPAPFPSMIVVFDANRLP